MSSSVIRRLAAALTLMAGVVIGFGIYGCRGGSSSIAVHDLRAQAEKDVRLFDVQVAFRDQKIPFGVLSKGFGASWFPVRYDLSQDFVMDVIWQQNADVGSQVSTLTIPVPAESERRQFRGVILTYTKADGWTGKSRLNDSWE